MDRVIIKKRLLLNKVSRLAPLHSRLFSVILINISISLLDLREQLLAQAHSPRVSNAHISLEMRHSSSEGAHDEHINIDPAIAGPSMAPAMGMIDLNPPPDSGEDDKKSGKRELSTSKRAAQNRAAQVS